MSKLLAVALALLTTTAGVAVAAPPGGSGPAGEPTTPENPAENANAGAAPADGSAGPPAELPDPVPEFVSSIHDLVREHVNGALSGHELGSALADLLGGSADAAGGRPAA